MEASAASLLTVFFSVPFGLLFLIRFKICFALADQLTLSINPLIPVFSQVWPEGFQSILTEVNREVSAVFPLTYDQLWEGWFLSFIFLKNAIPSNVYWVLLVLGRQLNFLCPSYSSSYIACL